MEKSIEGSVRITKTPDGEAPLNIRKEWVGVTLPVVAITNTKGRGVLSHKETDSEVVYLVYQDLAIKALAAKSKEAARWWRRQRFPQRGQYFSFKVSQTEVVGTLKEIPIVRRQFLGLLEVGVGAHDHPANK